MPRWAKFNIHNIPAIPKTMSTQQTTELRPGYGFAVTSLTLGILCLLILGWGFSIPGIAFGVLSLKTQGRDIGIAGLILCIIATIYRVAQTLVIYNII